MKLFGTIKNAKGVRTYFFGIKVYEERKLEHARKTYILGIKVRKKDHTKKKAAIPATLEMQQKIDSRIRYATAEQKILTLGLYYKDLPQEQLYVLCFDYLAHPYAEAIDAWTFFQYLQEKGIPSKYVLRRENPLFTKLQQAGNLKDILPVNNELDLLITYPHILAQSRMVISSFGFECSSIFKQTPFIKYVFIEHGVTLMKERAIRYYSDDKFDGKVVPTSLTKALYERITSRAPSCKHYYCGMPRWDKLQPYCENKTTRKIFIFFTQRQTFRWDATHRPEYYRRIQSFVNRLRDLLSDRSDIQLYIGMHHGLNEGTRHAAENEITGVNLVPMSEISTMAREADMCITDFSSICFDFLYRDVPVIFYCFDLDINYSNNTERSDLAADKIDKLLYNGCRDEDAAIAKVRHYVDRNFKLEGNHLERNKAIFWPRSNNCEQLWQLLNEEE